MSYSDQITRQNTENYTDPIPDCIKSIQIFNKFGKLLFSNKIAQAIYSILGKKLKRSTVMSEKYGVQGDESEVDGRNSNQGNKDISNDRNSEERFNLGEDESTRDNNGDKNNDEKFRQINSKVIDRNWNVMVKKKVSIKMKL